MTRHKDTARWILSLPGVKGEPVSVIPHLQEDHIRGLKPGDRVYGILPLHLIHRLLQRGVEYYAVVLPRVPDELRGKELDIHEIKQYGGRIWKVEALEVAEAKT